MPAHAYGREYDAITVAHSRGSHTKMALRPVVPEVAATRYCPR
jgi:hypothetical protein